MIAAAPTPTPSSAPLAADKVLSAGPLRLDGLAADTPPRPINQKQRLLSNPFLRLVLFLVLLLLSSLIAGTIATMAVGPEDAVAERGDLTEWPARLVALVATVAAYLVLILVIEKRRPPCELKPSRAGGLLVGLAIGAGAMLLSFVLVLALGGFQIEGLRTPDWPAWWATVFSAGVVAGVSEEMLFRGILFRLTEEVVGTWAAVAFSGILFGLAHMGNPDATWRGAITIAIQAGVSIALLYAVTRSLWVVMGMHAAWNVVQGPLLGVPISGTGEANGFLQVAPRGSDWISGGAFGIEASLVSVAVLVALSIFLGWRLTRSDAVVAPMWVRRARQRRALTTAAATPAVAS